MLRKAMNLETYSNLSNENNVNNRLLTSLQLFDYSLFELNA